MKNAVFVKSEVIHWWLWQEKQSQLRIIGESKPS